MKISGCATCRCGSEEKVWVVVLHWAVLMSRASARRRSQTPVQDKPGRPLGTQPLLRGGACAPLGEGTWWRSGLRLLFSRPGPRRLHPQTRPEVRLAAAFPWERESAFWRFVRGRPGTGVDLWVMITALVPEPESPNWARLLVLMSE